MPRDALGDERHNTLGQLGLGDTENRGDEPDEMGEALPPVKLWGPP